MIHTLSSYRGAVSAPHHLAAQSGLAVLRDGGNAVEAAVAAAATVAVDYPHMNSIGGDGFWLIGEPGKTPIAIDACGAGGKAVGPEFFKARKLSDIPDFGPLAAWTVAGTIAGWKAALEVSTAWGGRIGLKRLLEDSIHYARKGFPFPASIASTTRSVQTKFAAVPGFADRFLPGGKVPEARSRFVQESLGRTLERIADAGCDDFYRGDLARAIASDLKQIEVPLDLSDLEATRANRVAPLALDLGPATAYNLPPPTQGITSLMILGLFERLKIETAETFDHVHGLVEVMKQAFIVRNAHIADPVDMKRDVQEFLSAATLDRLAGRIDRAKALPWPPADGSSDTIWLGVIDGQGRAVSFIQSLYAAYGSGCVLPKTGILWQNRARGFSLDPTQPNFLRAGHKPFHTLNPAMARFKDGRLMTYGTRGADAQPQIQGAVFSRYAYFGQTLQQSISAPRWRLAAGRKGSTENRLLIETRFKPDVIDGLRRAGHNVEPTSEFDFQMGHAGALVHHANGAIEAAVDPRSDGVVAAF